MAHDGKEHGEGNYKASRKYNEATKKFVESGRVEEAARDAEPVDAKEAAELERAEAQGRRRAKEEDPQVRRKPADHDGSSLGVRVTDRPADETSTPEPGRD